MHARIARYDFTGDAQALAARAEDGLLPIFRSQPGFKAYTVIQSNGEIISFSGWDTAEQAEAAQTAAASWARRTWTTPSISRRRSSARS